MARVNLARASLRGVRSDRGGPDAAMCAQCQQRPAFPGGLRGLCVSCIPRDDVRGACYSCEMCVATREYLAETDSIFTLKGYDNEAELWRCARCGYLLAFKQAGPGGLRDVLHEKARRLHLQHACDRLKNGEVVVT